MYFKPVEGIVLLIYSYPVPSVDVEMKKETLYHVIPNVYLSRLVMHQILPKDRTQSRILPPFFVKQHVMWEIILAILDLMDRAMNT